MIDMQDAKVGSTKMKQEIAESEIGIMIEYSRSRYKKRSLTYQGNHLQSFGPIVLRPESSALALCFPSFDLLGV